VGLVDRPVVSAPDEEADVTELGIITLALVLGLGAALLVSYNRFVEQRQLVRDSWANVDTELQRRADLVPNLVRTVQGHAAHERAVLEAVTDARARAVTEHVGVDDRAADEAELARTLRSLFAVAEGYPELRAAGPFLELQRELALTEDRIQAARRFYNANVRDLNRRVESVPSNLVASAFGFRAEAYFEVEPVLRTAGAPHV
jgi:LemA protein